MLIIHDPRIPSEAGRKLHAVLDWHEPDQLTSQFIEDLHWASFGCADMRIVERLEVDAFPIKADRFSYTAKSYLAAWRAGAGFHEPDAIDYHNLLAEFDILPRIYNDEIDEVWLLGFPYQGCYESIMAGPGAFWCNAPALPKTDNAARRFVIMGFNYERGLGEMLESFGHRAESIMEHVYQATKAESNLWQRFTRYDLTHPGKAEVGNLHFAPNSEQDYDWGNPRLVPSYCDDWYHPPGLRRKIRMVNCQEWGNGDIRLHHLWWFRHLPHFPGTSGGISNNWWVYILDPNLVPDRNG
jgi:hypothetical protein